MYILLTLLLQTQPNCYARIVLVEGVHKIVIYSKTDIKAGDEITVGLLWCVFVVILFCTVKV